MNTKTLIKEVTSLPMEERTLVIDSLLKSLNQPESEIDQEWKTVAQRRLAELRTGAVTAIPGDAVFKRILNRFRK